MRTRRLLITRELGTPKDDKTSKTSWPKKCENLGHATKKLPGLGVERI